MLHPDIRIFIGTDGHWFVAERTGWRNPVELACVILRTAVSLRPEMFCAKPKVAVLALEWQEVYEEARLFFTLCANGEQWSVADVRRCCGRHGRVARSSLR
jgi:hypothetical protein